MGEEQNVDDPMAGLSSACSRHRSDCPTFGQYATDRCR